jgi:hypothetical protein
MAYRAATNLQHWQEAEAPPQTERVFVPAGEAVPDGLYNDEEIEELKNLGAIVDEADLKKEEDLQNRVDKLQAELERMRLENESLKSTQRSPGTLFQTEAVTEDTVDELDQDPAPSGARPVGGDANPGEKTAKDGKVQAPGK